MTAATSDRRRQYWIAVFAAFALAVVVLCTLGARDIATLEFSDPDDAMRLLEVQDWLAGQSWWDVSQHRLGGGTTFAMHWSRLVDLPIAAAIAALSPILGPAAATRAALVIVPMTTLFCTIALVAALTARLGGIAPARIAALVVPITAPLVAQIKPMRVDHHGWQIVCALAAVVLLLERPSAKKGALAGAVLATLMTISFEGLPIAAVIVAVAAVAWAFDPSRRGQAVATIATLTGVAIALQLVTRGPNFWAPACDAVAPAWLGAFIGATIAFGLVTLVPAQRRVTRLSLLIVPGVIALGILAAAAPACLQGGPFGMLDPFIRTYWFAQIPEGLPVWSQHPLSVIITFGTPVLGMVGAVWTLWRSTGDRRHAWVMMLAVQSGALVLALLVLRAGGTANALALPGAAMVVTALLERARAFASPVRRTAATAGALIVAAPSLSAPAVNLIMPETTEAGQPRNARVAACGSATDLAALNQLPRGRLFAPLDIGPDLLVRTRHEAIASGYHRNNARMHIVMAAFMGAPDAAHRAVLETGADYVVGCPGLDETMMYASAAPNGFWARLERGERFGWLQPVPIAGSPILAWRVLPTATSRQ